MKFLLQHKGGVTLKVKSKVGQVIYFISDPGVSHIYKAMSQELTESSLYNKSQKLKG